MKRLMPSNVNYVLLSLLVMWGCGTNTANQSAPGGITISSASVTAPILKRLPANPLTRIDVNVPATASNIGYQKISCTLNEAAINNLEKIDVYFTDTVVAFSTNNLIGSAVPSASTIDIPINVSLQPGTNHIWLSAVAKPTADIDAKIEVQAQYLVNAGGKKQMITGSQQGGSKRIGIAIRKAGDDGVNTYRIPGMVTTDKGTLLAVYDVRYNNSKDLPENIDVGLSRSTDGGKTWEPMTVMMDMGAPHENNGVGDPSILFDPVTKKIWVAALWSKGNRSIAGSEPGLSPDTTGQFVLVSSDDDGRTWSQPYSITPQIKDPKWHLYFQGPGSGIAMQNGTLVFPSQYWDESKKPGIPHSAIIYSDDHGKTWHSGTGAKYNTTESQVVETTPGTLMLNMRDNAGKFRSVATTTDMGKTWNEHPTSRVALPDPVCMGSFIKATVNVKGTMKEVLFFSNPNTSSGRYNISIKASLDLGETWLPANTLLIDERQCYGYSTLTKIDDNTIGLVYEGTKDLYFVRVPVGEIVK
ncbi:MAG TPA: exo-alpha-sialidase [Agriterribacter sp.]|nr:exo-alpha-sialidase [Agriterribacter sp.]